MSNPSPTRRGLLAGAAALSATGAAVPALAAGPDAELIALCQQFHPVHVALKRLEQDDDFSDERAAEFDATHDRWWDLAEEILEKRSPVTRAGLAAKALVFREVLPMLGGSRMVGETFADTAERHEAFAWVLVNDVLRVVA